MHQEFPIERNEDQNSKAETTDEIIIHTQELLDDGFYDKESCDEAIAMLNTARLLTEDPQAREQIDTLLSDIEIRYGNAR